MKTRLLLLSLLTCINAFSQEYPFRDTSLPLEDRVSDLVSRLTLEEKTSQMLMGTPAIERLGIPPYDWWNEALHGVGRSGNATIFPQAIGLAATFDEDLILKVATAVSDEARAMHNQAVRQENYLRYSGLTFWTPNVNIFRDPRWGRGQETYGEDPYLTSILGTAFVKGLQGDDPDYLKTAACAKHFAVHSGPEKLRHEFNAQVSTRDLYDTYLPAFKSLVDAGVESVMCAYNRTNDEPCCASNTLLQDILRNDWGFEGHIVSDCWALVDLYSENGHGTAESNVEAAALALKSGINVNCGSTFNVLADAVTQGLVPEELVDQRLSELLTTRFKLGLFDPYDQVPYNNIPYEAVNSDKHRKLAYESAVKSMVLLKNNSVLPLQNDLDRYYVVGPNAASIDALLGNYFGVNPDMVTVLEGLASRIASGSQLQYSPGTTLDRPNVNPVDWSTGEAAVADVTIMVMGLTRHIEGEEGESISSPYFGDRIDYNIPQNQIDYLKKIKSHGKPVIAVVTGGCPMNLTEVHEIADAVLFAWYPGAEGGNAVADVIFGHVSPSGKLPLTFPKSLDQLPAYEDYNMDGRTYRYMTKEPMYPFGFGLSFTTFAYTNGSLSRDQIKKNENTVFKVTVENTGNVNSDEIVQLYVKDLESSVSAPLFSLKGTQRVSLEAGSSKELSFNITPEMLMITGEDGKPILEKGDFILYAGGALPSDRSTQLGMSKAAQVSLTVK